MKEKQRRMYLSFLLSMMLFLMNPAENIRNTHLLAWWGTLYPSVCLGIVREEEENIEIQKRPKISFYLAKLLDW